MNKLKLDLDVLEVESFATRDVDGSDGGTVLAHNHSELGTCTDTCGETQNGHTCYETCAYTCDPQHQTCGRTCIWTE